MVDMELLNAISNVMDEKLKVQKREITEMIDEKLEALESRFEEKLKLQETRLKQYVDERLRESENLILEEFDKLEQTVNQNTQKINGLEKELNIVKIEVGNIRNEVHMMNSRLALLLPEWNRVTPDPVFGV